MQCCNGPGDIGMNFEYISDDAIVANTWTRYCCFLNSRQVTSFRRKSDTRKLYHYPTLNKVFLLLARMTVVSTARVYSELY